MTKNQKYDVGRPLVHGVLFYILGIICAKQFFEGQHMFLMMPIMSLFIMGYIFYFGVLKGVQGFLWMLMGVVVLSHLPVIKERNSFIPKQCYTLKGKVQEVSVTPYYKWVTLNHVQEEITHQKLRSKVQIRLKLNQNISVYDDLIVEGECLELTPKMNPSDFDYATYLKGKGIVAHFKAKQVIKLEQHTPLLERIRETCTSQLEKLLSPDKVGIMEAALLGDDSQLDKAVNEIYQKAGIGHVLCISGELNLVLGIFDTTRNRVKWAFSQYRIAKST